MHRVRSILALALLAFVVGVALVLLASIAQTRAPVPAQAVLPDRSVVRRARIIVANDLADAAVAVFDSVRPRIYLNTRLLAQIGPDLAAFLRAHEEGHLAYRHVPERRFGLVRIETPVPVLHSYEFAADCYAAQVLREERPGAVRAAIRFFQNRRSLVTDSAHPSMGARADQLLDCLTDPSRRVLADSRR